MHCIAIDCRESELQINKDPKIKTSGKAKPVVERLSCLIFTIANHLPNQANTTMIPQIGAAVALLLIQFEHSHKRFLRNINFAHSFHTFLTFCLLL